MKSKIYVMSVDQALEFFESCIHKEAVKLSEREAILDKMSTEGKVVSETVDGTPDQVAKLIAKDYNVTKVGAKKKPSRGL